MQVHGGKAVTVDNASGTVKDGCRIQCFAMLGIIDSNGLWGVLKSMRYASSDKAARAWTKSVQLDFWQASDRLIHRL